MGSAWQDHVGTGLLVPGYGPRTGPTRQVKVITEEGPTRGQVGGVLTQHGDGRQDATVFAPHNRTTVSVSDYGFNRSDYREIVRILRAKFGPGAKVTVKRRSQVQQQQRGLILPGKGNP
jgi:hypothetical protein